MPKTKNSDFIGTTLNLVSDQYARFKRLSAEADVTMSKAMNRIMANLSDEQLLALIETAPRRQPPVEVEE